MCGIVGGRECVKDVAASPAEGRLLLNAIVYTLAWVAYYTAARDLQLAELETIYYVSPVITTVLAVLLLGEHVPLRRWMALSIGFAGVVLACRPHALGATMPMVLLLLGAGLWAWSVVLTRQLSGLCRPSPSWRSTTPCFSWRAAWLGRGGAGFRRASELLLLLGVGLGGFVAQYLLYDGIRRAHASVVAPLEYTGLLWSFALGFAIWGDVPAPGVFAGAGLIILSGLMIIVMEEHGPGPEPNGSAFGTRLRRLLTLSWPARKPALS